MIKRTLTFRCSSGDTEIYDIEETETEFIVKYSKKDLQWIRPGEVSLKYTDTGNEIIFEFENEKINIPYSKIELIKTILNKRWKNEYTHRMKK